LGTKLTAALAHVTTAWIHHPAATGIDHEKATAVIGNPLIATIFLIFSVRFADIGFLVGHNSASFICFAP
jgi:hypothetical protein